MKRHLRESCSGVEGLPFKMIIIMVILAISLPIIFTQYRGWDMTSTENGLRNEIEYLITRVKMVYLSGEGNTANVQVNFKNGAMAKVDYVTIGSDPSDPSGIWAGITYRVRDRDAQTIIITDPQIPMSHYDGTFKGLELGQGMYTIHLSVKSDSAFEQGRGIDTYVEVSLA